MFTKDQLDELNLLARFRLDSLQEGLKIHSSAAPEVVRAAQRLFDKGLITQPDGGYLTNSGINTAMHVQTLLSILTGPARSGCGCSSC